MFDSHGRADPIIVLSNVKIAKKKMIKYLDNKIQLGEFQYIFKSHNINGAL